MYVALRMRVYSGVCVRERENEEKGDNGESNVLENNQFTVC